ncbi:hypothetical protein, partial [Streptomyces sp. NPDC088178]|uniref:hypothetical protein n=1 Tax=Streptomyces sp. NPDC088178 TaxID=3365836 RepID=UPI00381058FF
MAPPPAPTKIVTESVQQRATPDSAGGNNAKKPEHLTESGNPPPQEPATAATTTSGDMETVTHTGEAPVTSQDVPPPAPRPDQAVTVSSSDDFSPLGGDPVPHGSEDASPVGTDSGEHGFEGGSPDGNGDSPHDSQSPTARDADQAPPSPSELVERMVRARDERSTDGGEQGRGEQTVDQEHSAHHQDDVPLRPMTQRERQEWVQQQVLDARATERARLAAEAGDTNDSLPEPKIDEAGIRSEAETFLHDLHQDLTPLFAVSPDAEQYFAPPPPSAGADEAKAAQWHGEQARMANERDAELAEAQRDADRQRGFEEHFDQWGERRLTDEARTRSEDEVHDVLDWAENNGPSEEEARALSNWAQHRLLDDGGGLHNRVASRLHEAAHTQVKRSVEDFNGSDRLGTREGMDEFLDRQWVIENALEQVDRWVGAAFERWKGSLSPERRAWLDETQPEPLGGRSDRTDGDGMRESGSRQQPPTRAQQALEQAQHAFDRRARVALEDLLHAHPDALRGGPQRLIDATALTVDAEIFGLHEVFGRARTDGALGSADPGARQADAQARDLVVALRTALPELHEIFDHTVLDTTRREQALQHFEATADQLSIGSYGSRGDRTEHDGALVLRDDQESRLSAGGRARLRRQWLEGFDRDYREIFGEPGSAARRHGDPSEAGRQWEERHSTRERELPGHVELHMAKEGAAREAVDAVKEAANGTWKQALDGLGTAFREKFGLQAGDELNAREATMPAQRTAAFSLGSEIHRRLDEWARGENRNTAEVERIIEEYTGSEAVQRKVAIAVARAAVENAAKAEAYEQLAAHKAEFAPEDARDRFVQEHAERATALFDELFDKPPAQGDDSAGAAVDGVVSDGTASEKSESE